MVQQVAAVLGIVDTPMSDGDLGIDDGREDQVPGVGTGTVGRDGKTIRSYGSVGALTDVTGVVKFGAGASIGSK